MAMALPAGVERDVALSFNTLRLSARAELFVRAGDIATLRRVAAWQRASAVPWTLLGGASNVVLSPRVRGLVVQAAMCGVTVAADRGDEVVVHAAAGESWHGLVRRTLGLGLGGLENLVLIPGSVGAAPVQNIGAYGAELHEVCESVDVYLWDEDRCVVLAAADCGFTYRDSRFNHDLRGRAVITGVSLRLRRNGAPRTGYADVRAELAALGLATPVAPLAPAMSAAATAVAVAEAVVRVRRRKLPDLRRHGSVGSFFHNVDADAAEAQRLLAVDPSLARHVRQRPDGRVRVPAAALIERCGFKGRRTGALEVWRRQPLVLVNHGGATFAQVMALAAEISGRVSDRFGIALVREPSVIG
jgi:UDP-N-acetylmuramate dehydrogenase